MTLLKWLARSPSAAAVLFCAGLFCILQSGGSAQVWRWSQTFSNNGTVDPSMNWQEGIAPSVIDDNARAMMGQVAKWRDDLNGTVTTGGTSTAFTVTTNQGLSAFTVGHRICFNPGTTNGATVTINVDGLGAKPLRSAPGVEIGAGVLIQGTPYCATYFSSNSGEYILESFYGNPFTVPLGSLVDFTGTTAPNSNFIFPFGQAISRTTYASYFSLVSTTYGSGDGVTTFNVPDLRGRVVIAMDTMPGSAAAGRVTTAGASCDGTTIGTGCGAQNVALAQSNLPNVTIPAGTLALTSGGASAGPVLIGGATSSGVYGGTTFNAYSTTQYGSAGIGGSTASINGNVTQTTVNKLMPGLVLTKILRIF